MTPLTGERPQALSGYEQDKINGIVRKYAEPPFHCEVHLVARQGDGAEFPVIVVPGEHSVPIRAKKAGPDEKHLKINTYPIRRPGPSSEPPQSGAEWDELLRRCILTGRRSILDDLRRILEGRTIPGQDADARDELEKWNRACLERWQDLLAPKASADVTKRYSKGCWTAAYRLAGSFPGPRPKELLEILRKAQGHETGWPVWAVYPDEGWTPYSFEGLIECWLEENAFEDGAHSDFWRASTRAELFLLRGHEDDSPDPVTGKGPEPGTVFDLLLPIWRVAECCLHAERLARKLASEAVEVEFRFEWTGLDQRRLVNWSAADRRTPVVHEYRSRQDSVLSAAAFPCDRIGAALPDVVGQLVRPLHEAFDFFDAGPTLVEEEVNRLRRRV